MLGAGTLDRRSMLWRLGIIGGVGAASLGGFLYAGAWIGPARLTPRRFVDRFEQIFKRNPGFRRNHAKGISASGYFTSNGAGTELSSASVFAPGRTDVIGRFSLSGGAPTASDAPDTVRGLGLRFDLPGGEEWRTAMVNTPVFLDRVPEGFFARILASKPDPKTGKPDPAAMAEFLTAFPETARAMAYVKQHPASSGFENSTFYGLNAFWFTSGAGSSVPVRWRFVPRDPVTPAGGAHPPGRDYLFRALIDRAAAGPLHWDLHLIVGRSGDPTDDATTPWPPDRRVVTAGTLTLDALQTEAAGNARDVNFDPLVLPSGIGPSDDPLLSARSAVYAESYTRRSGEPKSPSAVVVPGGHHGA